MVASFTKRDDTLLFSDCQCYFQSTLQESHNVTTLIGVTAKERLREILTDVSTRQRVSMNELSRRAGHTDSYFANLFMNGGKTLDLLDRVAELVGLPMEKFLAPSVTSGVKPDDDHSAGEKKPEITEMPELTHKAASLAHEFMDVPPDQRVAAWDEAVAMFRRRSQARQGQPGDRAEGDL